MFLPALSHFSYSRSYPWACPYLRRLRLFLADGRQIWCMAAGRSLILIAESGDDLDRVTSIVDTVVSKRSFSFCMLLVTLNPHVCNVLLDGVGLPAWLLWLAFQLHAFSATSERRYSPRSLVTVTFAGRIARFAALRVRSFSRRSDEHMPRPAGVAQ
eukprot:5389912-Pleurochrysis_carterae.AAC.1